MPEKEPPRHEVLPLDDPALWPEQPVPHVDRDVQAASMRRLRERHNEIPNGYINRDRQMQAWALSNSLSRHDMARAIGVHKTVWTRSSVSSRFSIRSARREKSSRGCDLICQTSCSSKSLSGSRSWPSTTRTWATLESASPETLQTAGTPIPGGVCFGNGGWEPLAPGPPPDLHVLARRLLGPPLEQLGAMQDRGVIDASRAEKRPALPPGESSSQPAAGRHPAQTQRRHSITRPGRGPSKSDPVRAAVVATASRPAAGRPRSVGRRGPCC